CYFVRFSRCLFACWYLCFDIPQFAESDEVCGNDLFRDQYTEHHGQREDPLCDLVREQFVQSDGVRTVRKEDENDAIQKSRICGTARALSAVSMPQDRPTGQ